MDPSRMANGLICEAAGGRDLTVCPVDSTELYVRDAIVLRGAGLTSLLSPQTGDLAAARMCEIELLLDHIPAHPRKLFKIYQVSTPLFHCRAAIF